MYTFVSILYIFVCLFLILVVLLQSGKGGGLGSAFGGGTSQQIFGGAGAGNLLTRLTAAFAFAFMAMSVWLAFLSSSGDQALDRAVREQAAAKESAEVAVPAPEAEEGEEAAETGTAPQGTPEEPAAQGAAPAEVPADVDVGVEESETKTNE